MSALAALQLASVAKVIPLKCNPHNAKQVKTGKTPPLNRFLLVFLLFATLLNHGLHGQFVVGDGQSPESLVGEVLLGTGVEVFDIEFNGGDAAVPNVQMASFSGGSSIFGIESGIILATGGATVAEGPNDFPSAHVPLSPGTSLHAEPDLEILTAPAAVRDVAVLTFSFVALGDVLRFRYVFASEEYNEYTCSSYNDVFGFFISGPGITSDGPFENGARNLARIPGTDVPVAINTVNQGFAGEFGTPQICQMQNPDWQQHSLYFVDNENNPDPATTQFDGYTKPFSIEVPVICGETYMIKLAIADAVDDKNDSAVLIEANSFASVPPLTAQATVVRPDDEGRLLEGCSTLKMILNRSDSTSSETVFLKTRNLANAANILPDLPESVTFYPNKGRVELEIPILDDAITQGARNFSIDILQIAACSVDTSRTPVELVVNDTPPLSLEYEESVVVDCNNPSEIAIGVSGGYPPYSIQWDYPSADGFHFEMHTDQTLTLNAVISDRCNIHTEIISIVLTPETFPPFEVFVPDSMTYNCSEPVIIPVVATGGGGEYEYLWTQDGQWVSGSNPFHSIPQSNSPLNLEVHDRCAHSVQKTIKLIPEENPLSVILGPDTSGQCNEKIHILPDVSGGFGSLSYRWTSGDQLLSEAPVLSYYPKQTRTIVLSVDDFCGQTQSDSLRVVVDAKPPTVILYGPFELCYGEVLNPEFHVEGGTPPMSITWRAESLEVHMPWSPDKDSRLTVSVTDACDYVAGASTDVVVHRVQASFHIDYDRRDYPLVNTSTVPADILWIFSDGSTSTEYEPRVLRKSDIIGPVVLEVTNSPGCSDAVSDIFDPPMHIYFPNAFTPDGDGLNEVFKVVGQDIAAFHLIIFDRGGRVVFETNDPEKGWSGESVQDGEYYAQDTIYSYRYRAQSLSGEWKEGVGSIQLLR